MPNDTPQEDQSFNELKAFFDREVCQRATKPLRDGIEIAIHVGEGSARTLTKINDRVSVEPRPPKSPDMTFRVTPKGVERLIELQTEDIGEIGVQILKLMTSSTNDEKLTAKVHIGIFNILRNGYLGVLPLGGPTVMKFLAAKGFTGIGKIKDALSRLKDTHG